MIPGEESGEQSEEDAEEEEEEHGSDEEEESEEEENDHTIESRRANTERVPKLSRHGERPVSKEGCNKSVRKESSSASKTVRRPPQRRSKESLPTRDVKERSHRRQRETHLPKRTSPRLCRYVGEPPSLLEETHSAVKVKMTRHRRSASSPSVGITRYNPFGAVESEQEGRLNQPYPLRTASWICGARPKRASRQLTSPCAPSPSSTCGTVRSTASYTFDPGIADVPEECPPPIPEVPEECLQPIPEVAERPAVAESPAGVNGPKR